MRFTPRRAIGPALALGLSVAACSGDPSPEVAQSTPSVTSEMSTSQTTFPNSARVLDLETTSPTEDRYDKVLTSGAAAALCSSVIGDMRRLEGQPEVAELPVARSGIAAALSIPDLSSQIGDSALLDPMEVIDKAFSSGGVSLDEVLTIAFSLEEVCTPYSDEIAGPV